MLQKPTLFLASESPRRAELLRQIGVEFESHAVNIDESQYSNESARDYVCRIAQSKAQIAMEQLAMESLTTDHQEFIVLGADTTIALEDDIIGKPVDRDHCQCILRRLSARQHQVLTAVAVASRNGTELRLTQNQVSFRSLTDQEIDSYCASAEPMDKAGAYAIQGKAAVFIDRLDGSYSSVMGLPLFETAELLQAAGITIFKS
jgi:septum formation protein